MYRENSNWSVWTCSLDILDARGKVISLFLLFMGINEAFSDNLGSNFDQTYNYYNFIGDMLCNFKRGKYL